MNQPATTLPRRANTIRAVAASMAHKHEREVGARQAVSDRIGYAVAAVLGSIAYRYFGQMGVAVLVALYAISALRAHQQYLKVKAR
jgi:hypothetical protein